MAIKTEFQLGEYLITTFSSGDPWYGNCYLVRHVLSGEYVVIDPGYAVEQGLWDVLGQDEKLKRIIITHGHHDHVVYAEVLCEQFGIPCNLHKGDVRLMRHASMYAFVFDHRQIKSPTAICAFEHEDSLGIESREIQILHTPGHTKGSVCYYFGDFIFTGDTVLYRHVGRTDTPEANADQLMASVKYLLAQLPADTVIFPGHGRAWTVREAQVWWQNLAASPPQYNWFGEI